MSVPARQVRARQASKPRARTAPSRSAVARPALRVVSRRRARRRPIAFYFMTVAVVGAMVFGVAAINVMLAQGAFHMQALSHAQAQLRQQNGQLRLEVAGLTAPNRIQQEARRLGLVLPSDIEIAYKHVSHQGDAASQGSPPTAAPRDPGGPE